MIITWEGNGSLRENLLFTLVMIIGEPVGFPSAAPCPFFQRVRTLTAVEIMNWKNPPAKPEERPLGEVGRPRTRARGALGRGVTMTPRRVGGRDKKGGRVPPPAAPCRSKRRSRKTRKGPKQNMTKHDKSDEKVTPGNVALSPSSMSASAGALPGKPLAQHKLGN